MMSCATCIEVLSAARDGEASTAEHDVARSHCETCAPCAAFAAALATVDLTVAEEVPDLASAVLAAALPQSVPAGDDALLWRWGLVFVAVAQVISAVVHLDGAHVARDQAAWEAALAAGFLWAAWRPALATGLLPLTAVLSVLLLVNSGLTDGAGGLHHLLAPVGASFLVLATRGLRTGGPVTA
jgi:hypothetical protein